MPDTLVVSHFFPPESLGGAHRWKQLIEGFPQDHQCRVLCPPPAFPYGEFDRTWKPIERTRVGEVPVTRLWTFQPRSDSTSAESNLGRYLNYMLFSVFATIYVVFNARKYDSIVTVSAPHTTFLPGVVGKWMGLSWVPDIFDLWLDNAFNMDYVDQGSLPFRFISALERRAICGSDHVLVITRTMADHFADKYDVSPDHFTLVPFGVDEDLFAPKDTENHSSTIVYTGNMGEAHALRPFIKAFNLLGDSVTLRLVGTGKRREELERLCRTEGLTERISFDGVVPRELIPGIIAEACASIVPLQQGQSLDYARPTKLLESMAVGTPFVASSLSEIERIAEESGAGFAVNNEPQAIADAIRTLVNDTELREHMGSQGIEFIDREHRWPMLAEKADKAVRHLSHDKAER